MTIIYFLEIYKPGPVDGACIRLHTTDTETFADVLMLSESAWIVPGTITE